jgi:DNA-binding response OmpR family regulator
MGENDRMLQNASSVVVTTEKILPSAQMGTILVVEDDPRMQKVLQRVFGGEGYSVAVAENGAEGLEVFHTARPIAVVLDLMLPQISGRDVCKKVKALSPDTPVIVLSAITRVDKVLLLEFSADDYVTKPFSPRELLARVQAALRRRRRPQSSSVVRFGDCEVDFAKMVARQGESVVFFTALEFKLLKFFIDNAERVLSREELLNCGVITLTQRHAPWTARSSS